MKRITIDIPEQVLAQLDAIAEREGKTRNDVILDAINAYIAGHRNPMDDSTVDSTNLS